MSTTQPASAPTAADYVPQHQLLDRCVSGDWREQSRANLREYFQEDGPAGALYSGRRFERLAGDGDTPASQNIIAPEDVLALSFLSITYRLPAIPACQGELSPLVHSNPACCRARYGSTEMTRRSMSSLIEDDNEGIPIPLISWRPD